MGTLSSFGGEAVHFRWGTGPPAVWRLSTLAWSLSTSMGYWSTTVWSLSTSVGSLSTTVWSLSTSVGSLSTTVWSLSTLVGCRSTLVGRRSRLKPLSGGLQAVCVVQLIDPCVSGDRIGKRYFVRTIDDDPLSLSGISREKSGFRI